jgi:hypothetical protein
MKKILILSILTIITMTSLVLANCYQESFNERDQTGRDGNCGLFYNGSYYIYGYNDPNKFKDGDYNTYTNWQGYPTLLLINYTKPVNATGVTWKVKTGYTLQGLNLNFNLSKCMRDIVSVKVYFDNRYTTFYCFNGTDWDSIGNYYYYPFIFDEGMDWEISNTNSLPPVTPPQNNTNNQTCTNQTLVIESIFKPSTISFTFNMNKIGTYVCTCIIQ